MTDPIQALISALTDTRIPLEFPPLTKKQMKRVKTLNLVQSRLDKYWYWKVPRRWNVGSGEIVFENRLYYFLNYGRLV